MTLQRRTPLRRTGIRPISQRKRDEIEARRDVRIAVARRDGDQCRARSVIAHRFPDQPAWLRCEGPPDCHEIIPRSEWRDGYLDVDNVILVCRFHHEWIHNHTTTARTLGLLSHGGGLGA